MQPAQQPRDVTGELLHGLSRGLEHLYRVFHARDDVERAAAALTGVDLDGEQIQRLDAHLGHQGADVLAADVVALGLQQIAQRPGPSVPSWTPTTANSPSWHPRPDEETSAPESLAGIVLGEAAEVAAINRAASAALGCT